MNYAEQVLAGLNPVINFAETYKLHEQLRAEGVEVPGVKRIAQRVTRTVRYRVNHGNGYFTQQTWHPGHAVPSSEDIPVPEECVDELH